jgi:ABC-type nitrate/sulfonate/bicarbonate transport system permease component
VSAPSRQRFDQLSGAIPFLMALIGWALLSRFGNLPEYMLPPLSQMWVRFRDGLVDGTLLWHVAGSLYRLAISFLIGNALAIPLGIAIAMNRHVSDLLRPVLTFFQSIAGIAWVPLALIWFGVGMGSVIFVITNTIFFGVIYSTIIGVQTIPKTLHRAVLCHGGRGIQVFTELILPGALVQIILGLRTSMAYGRELGEEGLCERADSPEAINLAVERALQLPPEELARRRERIWGANPGDGAARLLDAAEGRLWAPPGKDNRGRPATTPGTNVPEPEGRK